MPSSFAQRGKLSEYKMCAFTILYLIYCSLGIQSLFFPFLLHQPNLLGSLEGLTGLILCAVDGDGVQTRRGRPR